jgi:uncharacterized Zn-finger protein
MLPTTFLEIRINADDMAKLEQALNVEGWQKALHEQQQVILDQGNVIAGQERELREMREKLRGLYEDRDRLQQRVSESETEMTAAVIICPACGMGYTLIGWPPDKNGEPDMVMECNSPRCPYCGFDNNCTHIGTISENCEWEENSNQDFTVWVSSCGGYWQFDTDGPVENGFKVCPYCGRRLSIATIPPAGSEAAS